MHDTTLDRYDRCSLRETLHRCSRAGLTDAMGMPLVGGMIAGWYGIDRASTREDLLAAAQRHPGFELRPV